MSASTSVSRVRRCGHCKHDMNIERTFCPHCGIPQHFPNVDLAEDPAEKEKIALRLQTVREEAEKSGCAQLLDLFAEACKRSKAITACSVDRLHRQVTSGFEIFQYFNGMNRLRNGAAEVKGLNWATLRPRAETLLFGTDVHTGTILYACLSLDECGLSHYGTCHIALSDHMIEHRSSCFEGNTAVVYNRSGDFASQLRCGFKNRHEICVAAFGRQIDGTFEDDAFSGVIKEEIGKDGVDDRFIEVHVFGDITAKTIESIRVLGDRLDFQESVLLAIVEDRMKRDNPHVEVIRL